MIPLLIWILCPADIVYLIKIDILGSRIKVMKKWCLRIFIWRYKGICLLYSPRMWRWSQCCDSLLPVLWVFSTYVEVILRAIYEALRQDSILHVCGGDPHTPTRPLAHLEYSPRMWRWSFCSCKTANKGVVFSTYVEVILAVWTSSGMVKRIHHVCGGDPYV